MTSIAAGHSHCLMTDGQRVWAMGSWLLSNGKKVRLPAICDYSLHRSTWRILFTEGHSILCWAHKRSAVALNACGARAKLSW
jgi:hypothetical protein